MIDQLTRKVESTSHANGLFASATPQWALALPSSYAAGVAFVAGRRRHHHPRHGHGRHGPGAEAFHIGHWVLAKLALTAVATFLLLLHMQVATTTLSIHKPRGHLPVRIRSEEKENRKRTAG